MAQKSITSFFKRSVGSGGSGSGSSAFERKKRDRDDESPRALDVPDPFRFRQLHIKQQKHDFEFALSEIEAGRKRDHWIWWVIPTPPHVEGGVEVASATNRKYALRDRPDALEGDAAARAYLEFPPVDEIHLRTNYLLIMKAALKKLQSGIASECLMGSKTDQCKLRASAVLFERVSRPRTRTEGRREGGEDSDGGGGEWEGDEEVNRVCGALLAALDAEEAAKSNPTSKTVPDSEVDSQDPDPHSESKSPQHAEVLQDAESQSESMAARAAVECAEEGERDDKASEEAVRDDKEGSEESGPVEHCA